MKKQLLTAAIFTTGLLVSSLASAAIIEFDFTGYKAYTSGDRDYDDTTSTYSVTASATTSYNSLTAYLGGNSGGLIVKSCDNNAYCSDSHYVDGSGSDESVFLDFGAEVEIQWATFYNDDTNEQFDFYADGNQEDYNLSQSGFYDFTNVNFLHTGSILGFEADNSSNAWKLSGVGVEYSSVPAPGSLVLLGLGLLGLGVSRRQKG